METEKSKEKQGGKEQRKMSGRRRKMVYGACAVDCRALVWPRALSCPAWMGSVIHRAMDPWIPKAAGGTGLFLLGFSCPLLQSAELCSNLSCPGCPAISLLPSTVHWGTGRTLLCLGCPASGRDGSNCLGLELPHKAASHREA